MGTIARASRGVGKCAGCFPLVMFAGIVVVHAETVYVPDSSAVTAGQVELRKRSQLANAKRWDVFSGFSFERQPLPAALSWTHTIVDDAGKDYKAVHYDHGNGIAVADVNNDGLPDRSRRFVGSIR